MAHFSDDVRKPSENLPRVRFVQLHYSVTRIVAMEFYGGTAAQPLYQSSPADLDKNYCAVLRLVRFLYYHHVVRLYP